MTSSSWGPVGGMSEVAELGRCAGAQAATFSPTDPSPLPQTQVQCSRSWLSTLGAWLSLKR